MENGVLLVLSGFSGAGKGTVIRRLLEKHDRYSLSVSATTRPMRPGEEDGKDYFFVSEERFQELIRKGSLLEYAQYVNHYYGTPRAFVEENLAKGNDVILEIDIQGAREVRRNYPDALLVFLTPPTSEELCRRLFLRGTEEPEVISERLRRAMVESMNAREYDYILINDDVDTCCESLHNLICAYHNRAKAHLDIINSIREGLRREQNASADI